MRLHEAMAMSKETGKDFRRDAGGGWWAYHTDWIYRATVEDILADDYRFNDEVKEDRHMCANGNRIRLQSGPWFDYDDPENSLFKLRDIAIGLSNTCRFGGQTGAYYSVAEHVVRCQIIARQKGLDLKTQQACLLHDSAEAVMCDVPHPLKMMLKEYKPLEHRVLKAMLNRFNLQIEDINEDVKIIDNILLKSERDFFFANDGVPWEGEDSIEKLESLPFLWTPEVACQRFLSAAEKLGIKDPS